MILVYYGAKVTVIHLLGSQDEIQIQGGFWILISILAISKSKIHPSEFCSESKIRNPKSKLLYRNLVVHSKLLYRNLQCDRKHKTRPFKIAKRVTLRSRMDFGFRRILDFGGFWISVDFDFIFNSVATPVKAAQKRGPEVRQHQVSPPP